MKFSKSLFLAFAGLGLFACSNEDVTNGGVEGNATVTVNIKDAISRAIQTPSTGTDNQTFPVEINEATITLDADAGSTSTSVTDFSQPVTDGGTGMPGTSGYAMELTTALVESNLAAPMYYETTTFTQDSETKYSVTLTPAHRMARLQFSGIKHVDADAACIYDGLTFDGLFLNNVQSKEDGTGTAFVVANTTQSAEVWETVVGDGDQKQPWGVKLYDKVEDGSSFIGDATGWPRQSTEQEDQCYGYNIFPAGENQTITELPKLTLCFSSADLKDGTPTIVGDAGYRFATVGKYIDGNSQEIKSFEAGKIYNITKLEVDDQYLGFTPEGGQDATLTATVVITDWTLVNGSVEWK